MLFYQQYPVAFWNESKYESASCLLETMPLLGHNLDVHVWLSGVRNNNLDHTGKYCNDTGTAGPLQNNAKTGVCITVAHQ